jgi:hypothetical protein
MGIGLWRKADMRVSESVALSGEEETRLFEDGVERMLY